MHARVTTMTMDPSRLDATISSVEEDDVPGFREIDGFKGFTLLVDRASGKVVGTSYWASREKMLASESAMEPSRARAAEAGGASGPPEVELFEVAIDTEA